MWNFSGKTTTKRWQRGGLTKFGPIFWLIWIKSVSNFVKQPFWECFASNLYWKWIKKVSNLWFQCKNFNNTLKMSRKKICFTLKMNYFLAQKIWTQLCIEMNGTKSMNFLRLVLYMFKTDKNLMHSTLKLRTFHIFCESCVQFFGRLSHKKLTFDLYWKALQSGQNFRVDPKKRTF